MLETTIHRMKTLMKHLHVAANAVEWMEQAIQYHRERQVWRRLRLLLLPPQQHSLWNPVAGDARRKQRRPHLQRKPMLQILSELRILSDRVFMGFVQTTWKKRDPSGLCTP
jgi:hypothetical protein